MQNPTMTPARLRNIISGICSEETAAGNGIGWSPGNPTWGHCAVASLIVQNLFGGKLLRISLDGTPFAESRSHYFNQLPDGRIIDVTREQFQGRLPEELEHHERTRDYVMNGGDTKKRYVELAWRLAKVLNNKNPLFNSGNYERCIKQALASPCQKMGFGAVIADPEWRVPFLCREDNKSISTEENNHPISGLESICNPDCVRLKIQSRTESILGSCGHAEEWAIWRFGLMKEPYDLFVAGVYANGLPYIKKSIEFTCLRCAVTINFAATFAGLRKIYVPVVDSWEALTPAQCLETAKAYALQEKKVD